MKEFFDTSMTALPIKDPIHPDQAYLLVKQVREVAPW
jgi:hypothetical protein